MFREKKQILILVTAAAAFGGFVLFCYMPMSRKLSIVKSARADQNLIVAKGISDSEQLSLFTEQLHKLRNKLDNYEANIPKQRDLGSFLKKIAELMDSYNLIEQVIEPLEDMKISGLACIPVNMGCKGKLNDIFQFYEKLQDLDRQIRIKQVKLKNGNDFSGEVKMETEIIIYYRTQAG